MRIAIVLLASAMAITSVSAVAATKPTATKPTAAKPAPAKKSATSAKKPTAKPDAPVAIAPKGPTGPRAPEAVKLRATTPAETEANAIWNVRAALNIAALQCQFLPFLATVRNYNDMLRHHSEELDRARLTMQDHFKRYDGAVRSQGSFDQYTTRTYNSFSSIDAQLPFCDMAGKVGREVLTARKGQFGPLAVKLNSQMRASLEPGVGLPAEVTRIDIEPRVIELPLD